MRRISRMLSRSERVLLIMGLLAALLSIACQTSLGTEADAVSASGEVRELKILQTIHFVPRYDEWFDEFAADWGEKRGVKVTVDHVPISELRSRTLDEIAAGSGHDLIEHVGPSADFEPDVLDLTDVNEEAQRRFGRQVSLCTKTSYNATTGKYFGFCHGWVPDPGDYRRSLWEVVDKPEGPETWDDLLVYGTAIKEKLGIQMGIGMSHELDSNMAGRDLLWAFGASIQDENENVVINSPEGVAAVDYMIKLYENAMTDEVFEWDAASNNKALISARASFILNSVSAYRTAQRTIKDVSDDVFFVPALRGPGGFGITSAHIFNTYIVPNHSQNADLGKEFLLHLTANYDQAVYNSEMYNFPAFPSTAPELMKPGGWLDNDPFESNPADKLAFLKDAESWSTNVGYPGPANAAIGEVFGAFIIPDMFAKAALGEMTSQEAVAWAEGQIVPIFEKWRNAGLVGGGK